MATEVTVGYGLWSLCLTADGQWHGNGGDCWLRILEFLPDGRTVSVRTFSPMFALSPVTCDKAWRTADYDQFTFDME